MGGTSQRTGRLLQRPVQSGDNDNDNGNDNGNDNDNDNAYKQDGVNEK